MICCQVAEKVDAESRGGCRVDVPESIMRGANPRLGNVSVAQRKSIWMWPQGCGFNFRQTPCFSPRSLSVTRSEAEQ